MRSQFRSISFPLLLGVVVTNFAHTQESEKPRADRVLRTEILIPVPSDVVWRAFSTEQGLAEWVAPVVAIELRSGGRLLAHYDPNASIGDPGTITTGILNFLEGELITFKVELNETFSEQLQEDDINLQEIVQIRSEGENATRVISSMVGWGVGPEWDAAYGFFVRGNEWTYRQLRDALSPIE